MSLSLTTLEQPHEHRISEGENGPKQMKDEAWDLAISSNGTFAWHVKGLNCAFVLEEIQRNLGSLEEEIMTARSAAQHRDILEKMQNFSQIVQELVVHSNSRSRQYLPSASRSRATSPSPTVRSLSPSSSMPRVLNAMPTSPSSSISVNERIGWAQFLPGPGPNSPALQTRSLPSTKEVLHGSPQAMTPRTSLRQEVGRRLEQRWHGGGGGGEGGGENGTRQNLATPEGAPPGSPPMMHGMSLHPDGAAPRPGDSLSQTQPILRVTTQKQTDVKPVKLAEEAPERLQPQGHFQGSHGHSHSNSDSSVVRETSSCVQGGSISIPQFQGPPKNLQKRPTAPLQAKFITEAPSRVASWQVQAQSTLKLGLSREAPVICGSPTALIRGRSPSHWRVCRSTSPSHANVHPQYDNFSSKNLPAKGRVVSRADRGTMNAAPELHFDDARRSTARTMLFRLVEMKRRSSVLKSQPDPVQIPSWAKVASPTTSFRPKRRANR